jgi:hypothetical protein
MNRIQRVLMNSPDTFITFLNKDTFDHTNDNEYLHINRCPIIKMPLWTNVKYIMIYNCDQLIDLPCWSQMIEIYIAVCPGLKKLPSWPNVENINIDNHIIKLGYWPKIKYINCYFCCYVSSAYYYKSLKSVNIYSSEFILSNLDVPQEFVMPTIKSNFFSKSETGNTINNNLEITRQKSDYHQKMKKIIIIRAWIRNLQTPKKMPTKTHVPPGLGKKMFNSAFRPL